MSATAKILDRLEHVRQTGPARWLARCPAHEDRSPSLNVRELDDGRILIHDFGGCQTSDVLAAIGLEISDLFEQPIGHELGASHSGIPARDLLQIVDHEVIVATIILADVIRDRRISKENYSRLALAAARIGGARDYANR